METESYALEEDFSPDELETARVEAEKVAPALKCALTARVEALEAAVESHFGIILRR